VLRCRYRDSKLNHATGFADGTQWYKMKRKCLGTRPTCRL